MLPNDFETLEKFDSLTLAHCLSSILSTWNILASNERTENESKKSGHDGDDDDICDILSHIKRDCLLQSLFLMHHVARIGEFEKINKINSEGVLICMIPNFFNPGEYNIDTMVEEQQNRKSTSWIS